MAIIETVLAFVVLVGILVFVHEMGHFLAARWMKMRADVFAVGMGPRLFGWNRKTGFTFGKLPEHLDLEGGTDYRLSAFPIGGYVKIIGMVDESMDTDYATRPAQPYEFRAKGTPAKILVISAGVIMNFLLAIGLYAGLSYFLGTDYQATTVVGALRPDNPVYEAGLRSGDQITAVNGTAVRYFDDVTRLAKESGRSQDLVLNVARAAGPATVKIPAADLSDSNFALPPEHLSVIIAGVEANGPADKAGLAVDDVIRSANSVRIQSSEELVAFVRANASAPITFEIERDGKAFSKQITPNKDKRIEINPDNRYDGPKHHVDYSLFQSLGRGVDATAAGTVGTFGLVGKLVTGQAKLKESVGGPVMIAKFGARAAREGLPKFIELMAALSVTLACMNILPIPALDGGHLVFIIIEAIIRREVSLKVRMAVQQVGFALLLIFMIFVLSNDVTRMLAN